jgi:predicted nucleotidyltransferase
MKTTLGFLNDIEKKVIKAFVKELKEKLGNEMITIRIFGSKVRGDSEKGSDMDIFILVKRKRDIRDKISDIAADYFFEYNVPREEHTGREPEFEERNHEFIVRIWRSEI